MATIPVNNFTSAQVIQEAGGAVRQFNSNDANVRSLAGKPSGTYSSADWAGKSSVTVLSIKVGGVMHSMDNFQFGFRNMGDGTPVYGENYSGTFSIGNNVPVTLESFSVEKNNVAGTASRIQFLGSIAHGRNVSFQVNSEAILSGVTDAPSGHSRSYINMNSGDRGLLMNHFRMNDGKTVTIKVWLT